VDPPESDGDGIDRLLPPTVLEGTLSELEPEPPEDAELAAGALATSPPSLERRRRGRSELEESLLLPELDEPLPELDELLPERDDALDELLTGALAACTGAAFGFSFVPSLAFLALSLSSAVPFLFKVIVVAW
jgi:hypothetical protein